MGDKLLADVVSAGDKLDSLAALRDRLAVEIDATDSARDVAALSHQLVDVLDRIAAVTPLKASKVDEIAKKRAARRQKAGG